MPTKKKSKFEQILKQTRELKDINKDIQKDRDLIMSLYKASLTCQTADKINTVFKIIGQELKKLDLGVTIYFLDKDKKKLVIKYSTLQHSLNLLKELAGVVRTSSLKFPVQKLRHYQQVLNSGEAHFFKGQKLRELLKDFFLVIPKSFEKDSSTFIKPVRSFIDTIIKKKIWTASIPMRVNGEKIGLFEVYATGLKESDLPILTTFAHQISNTLRNLKSSQEILLLNKELEKKVKQRTQELLNILRSKAQFIANASHELRTPLSVIQANWELFNILLHKDHKKISPQLKESAKSIKDQINNLSYLIEELLILAREDSGVYQFKKVKFDFARLIRTVVDEMEILAEKRGIKIYCKILKVFLLYGDEKMLKKTIENLIYNAVKYSRRGGRIDISLRRYTKQQVEFTVSDNGTGIAPEHLPHIFKHFYRASKSRSELVGGSGLGLTICQWIVEAHQGRIRVRSKFGEGSKFSVYLPRIPERER